MDVVIELPFEAEGFELEIQVEGFEIFFKGDPFPAAVFHGHAHQAAEPCEVR